MSLTGKQIANSYLDLLQMNNNNAGVPTGTPITVRDGTGNATPLQLSQGTVNINGNFQYNGIALTTNVSGLNAAAAGSSLVTGIVAEDGSTKFGRTLTASTGVTITNADGTAGNPTFAIADTSVSAGSYGPMNTITVDAQGRITDVTATTTISANAFIGGTLSGSSLYVENNVSVSGALHVAGNVSVAGTMHIDGNTSVANLWTAGDINSTGTVSVTGPLISKNITTSIVSATYLYGDGSNITGLAGAGTMTAVKAGTGIHLTENGITTTNITGSGTVALNTNQTFGTVSATSFVISGDNVAMSATVANLSATMATSIDNSNTLIAAVSALTSVNAAAVTSINSVVGTLSATMATSIDNSNTVIAAVSALTSVNTAAITSINSNIATVSAYATSITQALSATMATSIANHLPLAGGTMTGAITLPGNPSANLEAATKQYVDNLTAAAIHFHDAVRVESPVNLNATYNNGTAGVGATLTNAGTQAALVIDGVTVNLADRVLVYEQTDQTQNGVYTVTDVGSVSTNWVLTRATDADSYAPGTNSGLDEGSYFYVQEGSTGAGEAYVCNTIGTITFGTTNITFTQFSSALVYTAGTGININASRVVSTSGVPTNADLTALSATMATSINNTNTNVTTNINAITSINSVVGTVSSTLATSIANVSSTMATSINNTNTNLTAVSAYATSITQALSATMATSISNHLPLAGGTLTGGVVGSTHTVSANATTTPDFGSYSNFVWTLDGNLTLGNPTTETGGMGGTFVFIQDSTGSRTLSVGSEYKTVGGSITLSTAAGSVDVVPYFVQVTGTVLLGSPSLALA